MTEYRKAHVEDTEVLSQLRVEMLCNDSDLNDGLRLSIYNNTKQYILDGLKSENLSIWIAVNGNEIVSMCLVTYFQLPPNDWCPNGKTAYLGNLYTLPVFRKRGIAAKLLSMAIDEAKQNGCERILLNTTDMGKPLYETIGFQDSPTAMALYPFR